MKAEFIPICIVNEKFDKRFSFLWLDFRCDGTMMLSCNNRSAFPTDCHSFSRYANDVLNVAAFNEFTSLGIHYVSTRYRILKIRNKWYFKFCNFSLYSSSTKEDLLLMIKSYFKDRFNRLD